MSIGIIDYGIGNLDSVYKSFMIFTSDVKIVKKKDEIDGLSKIVLPGVSSFKEAVRELEKRNLITALLSNIKQGKPYLGICLGLQLLFEKSEESPGVNGLGVFKGNVKRFKGRVKVPHMGWNQIKRKMQNAKRKIKDCLLFKDIPDNSYFYFCHSYYAVPKDKTIIATTTSYGLDFTSSIYKDNIFGLQFHPEKSQALGLKVVQNFIQL